MDVYKLLIKSSAAKELDAIPKEDRRRIVHRKGDYRVIYPVSDERHEVIVFKIGHRREIYR